MDIKGSSADQREAGMMNIQKRHAYLIAAAVGMFLYSAIIPFLGMDRDLERVVGLAYMLFLNALCYKAAYEDAVHYGHRLPGKGAQWAFLLVAIIAIPYYLYRTRPWPRATLLFVAVIVLMITLIEAGTFLGIFVFTYFGGNVATLPLLQ